jgi:hypothetical protein
LLNSIIYRLSDINQFPNELKSLIRQRMINVIQSASMNENIDKVNSSTGLPIILSVSCTRNNNKGRKDRTRSAKKFSKTSRFSIFFCNSYQSYQKGSARWMSPLTEFISSSTLTYIIKVFNPNNGHKSSTSIRKKVSI